MSQMSEALKKKRDEFAEKRSKRQSATGNKHLDAAVSWYLRVGAEDGWDACHEEMAKVLDAALEHNKRIFEMLPKVPTEPYEKQLAKECLELKAENERLRKKMEE